MLYKPGSPQFQKVSEKDLNFIDYPVLLELICLQEWCSSLAVNLICNGPGTPVPAFDYDLHDPNCDGCTYTAAAAAPAPVEPTCTGLVKLRPYLPNDPTPPTLQSWCLAPAVNTVCNPGVSVLGNDTENACVGACTCPSSAVVVLRVGGALDIEQEIVVIEQSMPVWRGKERLSDVVGHAYRGSKRCRGYLEVGLAIVIHLIHDKALAPHISREPLLGIVLYRYNLISPAPS